MIHSHVLELKLTCAAAVGIAAGALDAGRDIPARGWEDMGLKGLLIGALVFVVRLLLKQQSDHKTEIKETWAAYKEEAVKREEKVVACMTAQSEKLGKLCELTEEQTEHYRTFVKAAVDAKLKAN